MSSLSPKDRVSLCSFTFSDGRRCRTPRFGKHPRFCFYHAQKEDRARATEKLAKDLSYFFSGNYLSACDLSTALARLIPAVVRGDVKPKTARTVAYLAQTLMQAIHISQHEYCEAFSSDAWRKSVRNSVNSNHHYRFPPAPEPKKSESPQPQPQPAQPQTQPPQAQPQPQTQSQLPASAPPSKPPQPAPVAHPFRGEALRSASPPQSAAPPIPAPKPPETPVNCHSERSEESAFSKPQADLSHPIPATQPARWVVPAALPDKLKRISPSTPQRAPNRDAHTLHFDHNCRLLIDGKPF